MGGCQGLGRRRRGKLFDGYRVPVLQSEKSFGNWLHNGVNVLNTTEMYS